MTLIKSAGLIDIKDVPELDSTCVHLAGISDTEFDMALMKGLKARNYPSLSVDMQSFVRHINPVTKNHEYSDVADKKEIAAMMDKLKLDVLEAKLLTGTDDLEKAAIIVESWGCSDIMITQSEGVLVRVDGKTYYEKFSNSNVSGRTGRGDTTFVAYLSHRLDHGIAESVKFAAALVSIKMETPGPFSSTLEEVYKRIEEKHS
jgi:sugar/nucleoside kinase (ribokinase family)